MGIYLLDGVFYQATPLGEFIKSNVIVCLDFPSKEQAGVYYQTPYVCVCVLEIYKVLGLSST